MMIPTRAVTDEEEAMKAEVDLVGAALPLAAAAGGLLKGAASKAEKYGVELTGFAKEKAKDAAMELVSGSPLGVVVELFSIGKDLEPIFDDSIRYCFFI
jgi:hypothetical protein